MSQPAQLRAALEAGVSSLRLDLGAEREKMLLRYLALLARWNRAYNLTAVREPSQMVPRHLLDCLAILPLVRGPRLLDVGSGAGLPGLVLAIARPTLRVVLLDASLKRTRFLTHAVAELALAGRVEVVRERLEEHRPDVGYDTVTSRASLPLAVLFDAATRLLAPAGRLVAMVGRAAIAQGVPVPAGYGLELVPLVVPGLAAQRHAAVLQRI